MHRTHKRTYNCWGGYATSQAQAQFPLCNNHCVQLFFLFTAAEYLHNLRLAARNGVLLVVLAASAECV